MNINNISSTTFDGKIIFDKKLTKPMKEYANNILDYPYLGKTARERIASKTYDINVFGHKTKKTIHPRICFSSEFKVLNEESKKSYWSREIKLKTPISESAEILNLFLLYFEAYKDRFDFSYNTFGEKVSAFIRKIFDVRKF